MPFASDCPARPMGGVGAVSLWRHGTGIVLPFATLLVRDGRLQTPPAMPVYADGRLVGYSSIAIDGASRVILAIEWLEL